jgi:hypothetical protein
VFLERLIGHSIRVWLNVSPYIHANVSLFCDVTTHKTHEPAVFVQETTRRGMTAVTMPQVSEDKPRVIADFHIVITSTLISNSLIIGSGVEDTFLGQHIHLHIPLPRGDP